MNPYDLKSGGPSVSRRGLFQGGAAAAVGGFAAQVARAQGTSPPPGQSLAATKFRAFARHGTAASVEELTLRPIQPEQVVLRTQAAQSCYTIVSVLGNATVENAAIVGHGGVGIVEAVGANVKRVRAGNRAIVPVTPQCGQCWMCLHGRADVCRSAAERPNLPVADMRDGTPVFGTLGGFAEIDDRLGGADCPGLHGCLRGRTVAAFLRDRLWAGPGTASRTRGAGLRCSSVRRRASGVECDPGSPDRRRLTNHRRGADPLSQRGRTNRREVALKVGATVALDPNQYKGNDLITKVRDLAKGPTDRVFAGGRGGNVNSRGPMYLIEAVGGDRFPPKFATGPDPTGVEVLQQVWQICPPGGTIRTCGVGHPTQSNVTFPPAQWSNAAKTHIPGNFAGVNTMRDLPLRLIETKEFDAEPLATENYPLERAREALQAAADRTTIASIVTFG